MLCATRGEAGESRVATDDLAAQREGELRAAAEVLGVDTVVLLDHHDSDMEGDAAAGTLAAADPADVVEQVRAVIDDWRPDVVVTLDGSDGHRDHAVMRDAAIAAAASAVHPPAAVYLTCLARSSMTRWAEHMATIGGGEAYLGQELGTPDDEITLVVDVSAELDTRWAAIRGPRQPGQPVRRAAPGAAATSSWPPSACAWPGAPTPSPPGAPPR